MALFLIPILALAHECKALPETPIALGIGAEFHVIVIEDEVLTGVALLVPVGRIR